jgi:hypothetical protein
LWATATSSLARSRAAVSAAARAAVAAMDEG